MIKITTAKIIKIIIEKKQWLKKWTELLIK